MMEQPLEGITVVSLEQAVAAPFATRQLADLGARVIKVERPIEGDFARQYDRSVSGESSYFVWLNRGKESIELNIKDTADRVVLNDIIATADVFVQNLVPGAAERLGLGAETLRSVRPELIHCSISGYGKDGPYSAKKAYDLLVQCEAGLLDATGTVDEPAKVGVSIADIATGMYAYSGILTALFEREKTHTGSTLEVAMIDALGEWMSQPMYYAAYGSKPVQRSGARHATIAPYGPYRAGDGNTVFLGVQSDREWAVLCHDVLGAPELVQDPRFLHNTERVENNDLMTPIIEEAFAGWSADAVVDLLENAGIANARMRTSRELASHPQLESRNRWREIETAGGATVRAMLPPVAVSGREPLMGNVPRLGSHNEAIRTELHKEDAPDDPTPPPAVE